MRAKEAPLRSAMVKSPLVAVTEPVAAKAVEALCSEARLWTAKSLVRALWEDRQATAPCSLATVSGQRGEVQAHGCGRTRDQEILSSLTLTMAMGGLAHSLGNGVHWSHCIAP